MNKFKYEAYLTEFPFLREILGGRCHLDCEFIRVARADENLLLRKPNRHVAVGSMVDIDDRDDVHFVLVDGTIIKDAVAQEYEYYSNYAHDESYNKKGETILEALAGLDNPDAVKYIIVDESGYEVIDHCSTKLFNITIYKAPKGGKISDYIEKARAQALAEVKAEANF